MSEPNQTGMKLPEGFQAGSIIAVPRADETAFPPRLSEFKILCVGANSGDRAGRDTCIGIFLSMLPTTLSMYLAIDWANRWVQRRWGILVSLAVPILIAAGSLSGSVFYLARMNKEDTPCSRLEDEIEEFFGPSEASPVSARSAR